MVWDGMAKCLDCSDSSKAKSGWRGMADKSPFGPHYRLGCRSRPMCYPYFVVFYSPIPPLADVLWLWYFTASA